MHLEKLKKKLEHWADHNNSHATSIREQAEEAGKMGLQEISEELLSAAEAMDRAGNHIHRAMEKL
jgi:molecular chaperone GrpE (heat shock protein)